MDHSWTPNDLLLLYIYMFYSRHNTDWIANTENVLDPNNSAIKRLRCIMRGSRKFFRGAGGPNSKKGSDGKFQHGKNY